MSRKLPLGMANLLADDEKFSLETFIVHGYVFLCLFYKTKDELNPSFMQEIFRENTTRYNLRNNDTEF